MAAELIYEKDGTGQISFPLDKDCITIGRSHSNDLLVDDPRASGKHARLIKEGDYYFLEDLGSSNKTFINETEVTSRIKLSHEDTIRIGHTVFTYIDPGRQATLLLSGIKQKSANLGAVKKRHGQGALQKNIIIIGTIILIIAFSIYCFYGGIFQQLTIDKHLKNADDYFEDKHYDRAMDEYNNVLKIDKENRKAFRGLANCYREQFNYRDAIKYYGKVIKTGNTDEYYLETCNDKGNTYLLYNDYREAAKAYKTVRDAKNDNPDNKSISDIYADTLVGLGKIDVINHKYKDAGNKYKDALDIDDKNIDALLALGSLYLERGKYEDSMHYFSTVNGADPDNTDASIGIASIYKKQGNYDRAVELYDDLIKDHRDIAEAYAEKADLYRLKEDYKKALSVLQEGEKENKNNPVIYITGSQVYYDKGDYSLALDKADRALNIHNNCLKAKNLKGNIFTEQGKTDKAIKIYKEVLEKDRENFDSNKGLGKAYLKNKTYDKSLTYLKKAKDINPLDRELYLGIGDIYYIKKDYDKAIEYYKPAFGLKEDDADLCCKIGDCYKNLGDIRNSLQWYQIALSKDSDCEKAREGLKNLPSSSPFDSW